MYINKNLYEKICKNIPILCIDLIISFDRKYLLLNRKNPPLRGEYWLPGGRILLGESFTDAACRIMKKELSIELCDSIKSSFVFCGNTNMVYNQSIFGNHKYHTPALVFSIKLNSLPSITLDETSLGYIWSERLPEMFLSNFSNSIDYV